MFLFAILGGAVLLVLAILVGLRIGQGIGGEKAAQQKRAKLAATVAPFLQLGEQTQCVFRGQVQDSTGWWDQYIFAITDRAIVMLDCTITGKPWQVRQRYSPDQRFGPLHKSPWGLIGGLFTFEGTTYKTAWQFFPDVEAADSVLSQISPGSSTDPQPDVTAVAPPPHAEGGSDQPADASALPSPRKPPRSTRVMHWLWTLATFTIAIRFIVAFPALRWIAVPALLLIVWSVLRHLGGWFHRAWVRHEGIHAPIWLLGGFVVGVVAAVAIPGDTGGVVGLAVWAVFLTIAVVSFIAWIRGMIHHHRALNNA